MNSQKFRFDINGLRAWAVIAVIAFHAGINTFNGGFIGVDVFFVISGFLMTAIVLNGLQNNSFSIVNFYFDRATRILPALVSLCLVLIIAGWFLLPALPFTRLATHTVSALVFLSNIQFWRDSGYFDTGSHEKLLLHTWSLSVEWQFYILFPLALKLVHRFLPLKRQLAFCFVAGIAASLLLSICLSPNRGAASFYLLPTRIWELLAGGLVFLAAQDIQLNSTSKRTIEGAGLILIVLSILVFDSSSEWPGWRALIPVTGTILVLIADRQESFWTNNGLLQFIGKISYSLYLWHWPFFSILFYFNYHKEPYAVTAAVILAVIAGWMSYKYIETPFRGRSISRARFTFLICISLAVFSAALVIRYSDGMSYRHSHRVNLIFDEANNRNLIYRKCHARSGRAPQECRHGGETPGAIVLGDSHALSAVKSIRYALKDNNLHVVQWTASSCPIIEGADDPLHPCTKLIEMALNGHKEIDPSVPLFIITRTSTLLDKRRARKLAQKLNPDVQPGTPYFVKEVERGIIDTACKFASTRPVYFLRPIPELPSDVPLTMGRAALFGINRRVSLSLKEYHRRHRLAFEAQDRAAKECGIKILDPLPYLCDQSACYGDRDGLPVYSDDDHLSNRGAVLLSPLFEAAFRKK